MAGLPILRRLAIYRTRPGLLWQLFPFLESDQYNWRAFPVPTIPVESFAAPNFAARQQIEDQISVQPGSFLLMITGSSDNNFPNDFRFQVTDKGTGQALGSDFLRYSAACGSKDGTGVAAHGHAGAMLPFIVPAPWTVSPPGLVMVRITNLNTAAQNIRLMLTFAEPRMVGGCQQ